MSQTKNFDQFARQVPIGPFTFDVVSVSDGKVTLKYNVAQRKEISASDAAKLAVRPAR